MTNPTPNPPPLDAAEREALGKAVRDEWITWAFEQRVIKPSWITPWEHLDEPDREIDRRIGERLYLMGWEDWSRESVVRNAMVASIERLTRERDVAQLACDLQEPAATIMRAELIDYREIFDLRWKADRRAIERWRESHPERELKMPDHVDLVLWLGERILVVEAERDAAGARSEE